MSVVEYGLVLALVAIVAIVGLIGLGEKTKCSFAVTIARLEGGFRLAFGRTGNSIFDFDNDGDVDASDFLEFRSRYGVDCSAIFG